MPTSLVTGGAGFLGSHLCERLIKEGHRVTCMDNLLTGSKQNIANLMGHEEFTFVEHDVTRYIEVNGQLDYIFHFASPASPRDYQENPIHTLKVGALGTYACLGLAKAKGALFLLASSSEVYGDPEVSPQPEDYWGHVNPTGIRSVYDEAKRYAEAITMAYHRVHGIGTRIARIFNTYGPRMRVDDGRAIPNFIVQALKGEPITVYGDGGQTRSFCYVDDMVEGIFSLAIAEGLAGEVFNLGNPDEYTVLDLACLIRQLTGSKSGIAYAPLPADDPKRRRPDIAKVKGALGWEPKVELMEGLKKTISYFCAQMSGDRICVE